MNKAIAKANNAQTETESRSSSQKELEWPDQTLGKLACHSKNHLHLYITHIPSNTIQK